MIDRPSLLETPNLANKSTFIESPVPGESVDDCYAWDSLIRGDYDGSDTSEWEDGKQVQETLPAAQWDAMIHDITALSYQLSQVCNSLWEEMYCIIHGAQVGMAQEAITQLLSGAQTFTNKTISFDSNTMTNVASLDTAQTLRNKTISFDDNTLQNVASLNTAQTLTNKTIDKKDNIVKCSATVISTTPYTLTPTKEMNCIIDVASGVITLGSGPYDGYELPILAKQDCTVSYVGAGGSTSDNLTANQVTSYIWNGSAWIQNGVSIKPIFISTSGTVAPTSEANYVIDTASVTLTVQNGVYVGQKVWVTSNATGSQMWYTGINGSTLIGIQNGEIARMTWNGTYWFCEIIAIITGKDAEGNAFTYGGSVNISASPQSTPATITTNGATLDPAANANFLLNINNASATCSIGSGTSSMQAVKISNINASAVDFSYTGVYGSTNISLYEGTSIMLMWTGTYWSPFIGVDDPIPVSTDITISPKVPMSLVGVSPYVCITVGDGPYPGYRLPIMTQIGNYTYIKFKNDASIDVCVCIYEKGCTLIWNGTNWNAEDGAAFIMSDTIYTHRPAGTKPSDWKVSVGTYGTYTFVYIGTGSADYDIPSDSSNMTLIVLSRGTGTQKVIATQNYASAGYENADQPIFTRVANNGVWGNHWTRFQGGPGNGVYASDNPINTGRLASGGFIHKTTLNGVCYVHIYGLYTTSSTAQWYTVGSGFPVPWFDAVNFTTQSGNAIEIDANGFLNMYRANANQINTTFSYPIKR